MAVEAVETEFHERRGDLLHHVRDELLKARDDAGRAYDRCEALRLLADHIADQEAARGRKLLSTELNDQPDEESRAQIRALVLRAFPGEENVK
jgi:hypothetical protein